MQKKYPAAAVLLPAVLFLAGNAFALKPSSATAGAGTPKVTQPLEDSGSHGTRRKALLDRYARSSRKLDSLERDSLARRGEGAVYARLLREGHTRRDHTQYAIELLGYADTTDPTAWEVAHARAVDSLDSLERFLRVAEQDTLKPAPPRPQGLPAKR